MLKKIKYIKSIFVYFLFIFIANSYLMFGQIPSAISYQGVLTDPNGNTVKDGKYNMQFELFASETNDTVLWYESQTVSVNKGIFNVMLGKNNPLNISFSQPYWLQVTVNNYILSRVELSSSAYSFNTSRIQGKPVSSTSPSSGQVLKWNGSQWAPGKDDSGGAPSGNAGGDLTGTYPNPSIAPGAIGISSENIWKNLNLAPGETNNITVSCSSPWVATSALWNFPGSNGVYKDLKGNIWIGYIAIMRSSRSNDGRTWTFNLYNFSQASLACQVGIACIKVITN